MPYDAIANKKKISLPKIFRGNVCYGHEEKFYFSFLSYALH